MNVLVTGAEGALANHVVERLIKDGGYNVHCLDLRIPKEEQRNHDMCSYIQTDITKYGDVESALEGMQAVFHVASITPIVDLLFSHDDYYRVNVTGTENIVRACKLCNIQRLVYTSTSAVTKRIGLNHPYTDESTPYPELPHDIYAETKAAAEKLVLAASGTSGLRTCSLRPAGMLLTKCNPIIRYLIENRSVLVKNGTHGLSFVTAEAAAIAHILAEQKLRGNGAAAVAAGKVYILANTEKVTYNDLFGRLVSDSATIWGQPPPIYMPKWVFVILAYVNEYFYKLTHIVLVSKFLSSISLGYLSEDSFSSLDSQYVQQVWFCALKYPKKCYIPFFSYVSRKKVLRILWLLHIQAV